MATFNLANEPVLRIADFFFQTGIPPDAQLSMCKEKDLEDGDEEEMNSHKASNQANQQMQMQKQRRSRGTSETSSIMGSIVDGVDSITGNLRNAMNIDKVFQYTTYSCILY